MDRRIHKTRNAIIEAFVGLMAEKNFEQITINEIADKANVNRGTIYLHYVDKHDLLEQCIEIHLDQLFQKCPPGGDTDNFSSKDLMLRMFEYLEQHAFFYSTILTNKGIPAFRKRLLDMAKNSLSEQINKSGSNQNIQNEVLIQFLASAGVGVIEWWITNSMPYPAKDMVEEFWQLLERFQI
ncbi:TetR/AcrR family transcriptional regulator [Paenibacillus wynnii]|uniref:TetR/AcrR family transcriptional regulator n=1 Tax=Paenibacillus wynnii TaxID=268407 RepID=UPI002790E6EE|nr:TetR/AcrR family transcriptional regulator [Paenibacillus wynnii]MDQ0194730.1 AcrR family transcriptional regulator [Paenibacillus wynnii]